MVALNRKIVGNRTAQFTATLVTLAKQGGFVARSVDYPGSYSDLAFGGNTDKGDLILVARKGSDELKEIALLLTSAGVLTVGHLPALVWQVQCITRKRRVLRTQGQPREEGNSYGSCPLKDNWVRSIYRERR